MADVSVIAYNVAAFISTLFLLEFGADKFIDHTAVVARLTGVPEIIIGLLTAGGEWEELAVVVASLARNRGSLAIGNIVGAAISNIFGAFSLGLLFHPKGASIQFDTSSRIYSSLLLVLTTFVTLAIYFSGKTIWVICGAILVAFFGIYLGSVAWAISRGRLMAPQDSDDESSDGERMDGTDTIETTSDIEERDELLPGQVVPYGSIQPQANRYMSSTNKASHESDSKRRTLKYHIFYLFLGFFAICLAGYVLSQAATNITDQLGMSDVLFGVIIPAIATTLPEKFVAVMSGNRGHAGILVANTAGSNIFLLTLCLGITMIDTAGEFHGQGNVNIPELCVLWGSTFGFTLTVWFGGRFCRWIELGMVVCYIAFIVLEFTVIHRV
ncbi:hypothetical protein FQN54_008334 [Arachnomyces sp. PD_36]|nr:hypothetical protein FQN54_008334 [Arachnomyces sp. PD_36]